MPPDIVEIDIVDAVGENEGSNERFSANFEFVSSPFVFLLQIFI